MGEPKRGARWHKDRAAFMARHSETPEAFSIRAAREGLRGAETAADAGAARRLSYPVGHPDHPLNPSGRWLEKTIPLEMASLTLALFMGPAGYSAALYDAADRDAPRFVAQVIAPSKPAALSGLLRDLAERLDRDGGSLASLLRTL